MSKVLNMAELRACQSWTIAVLGLEQPTRVPCGLVMGHVGPHEYRVQWEDE